MPRTKRLDDTKTIIPKATGIAVSSCHCRKCREDKRPSEFFLATDLYLDTNGFMSICKQCIDEMYSKILMNENSIERTILKMCRILNVAYSDVAIDNVLATLKSNIEKGRDSGPIFSLYKLRLIALQKIRLTERDSQQNDLTFVEPTSQKVQEIADTGFDSQEYYEEGWGKGLNLDDYLYLEQEFGKWKKTTECNSQGEEILVRELCHKQNEIRKARVEGKSVDSLVKSLQEIMKNSALTPALANAASSGKNAEAFGNWIKDIENLTPAEWWEQQSKFADMDGLQADRDDIKRSIGNYIMGSRDYNTTDLEEVSELDFSEEGE